MQLLSEEFFKKVSKAVHNINVIPIRILTKAIFYGLIGGIFGLIVFSFSKGNYIYPLIFMGLILLAEIAHYLRKSREKVMVDRITKKNIPEEKQENEYLLKHNKPKNEILLRNKKLKKNKSINKKVKSKNKNLLGLKTKKKVKEKSKNKSLLK